MMIPLMTPFGELPIELIRAFCITATLNVCLYLYCTISAFFYKFYPLRSLCCLGLTLFVWFIYSQSIDLMLLSRGDDRILTLGRLLNDIPCFVPLILIISLSTFAVYMTVRLKRWKGSYISMQSVKEACDSLPTGLCFFDKSGMVYMKNELMDTLSVSLCNSPLLNGNRFWSIVTEHDEHHTDSACTVIIDGLGVWSFSRVTLTDLKEDLTQITATDISELYALTRKLDTEIKELGALNVHLKNYNEMVSDITREEEILRAKESIHARLGTTLITTRRYIENDTVAERCQELTRLWRENTVLLKYADDGKTDESFIKDIENAASLVGIDIRFRGDLPLYDKPVAYLLTAAVLESLNNAVRHGNATEMLVSCDLDKDCYRISITNNGSAPDKEIAEGGGLNSIRRKAASLKGTVDIIPSPHFTLKLTIPESEVKAI